MQILTTVIDDSLEAFLTSPGTILLLLALIAGLSILLVVLIRKLRDWKRHDEIRRALAAMPEPEYPSRVELAQLRRRSYDDRTL
jgi:hypothetical protein